MQQKISRRDFLKLTGVLSSAAILPLYRLPPARKAARGMPNILILVYDAFSAQHANLYGYPRKTTPNINRLADRATVFHQHYAGGNYTFPGTSTLLTGTYPWTHRGFSQYKGIDPQFHDRNIFQLFDQYHRISYSHNSLANNLFTDMHLHIDQFKPRGELLLNQLKFSELLFRKDESIAWMSWWLAIEKFETAYTPFLSRLIKAYKNQLNTEYKKLYPRGLPSEEGQTFLLETATDWTLSEVTGLDAPFLGYFHYLPPHDPYTG
jgi:membrane-anchored protein YejM (alkaline phosphatase superfamily)